MEGCVTIYRGDISRECAGREDGECGDEMISRTVSYDDKGNVVDDHERRSELGRNSRVEGKNSKTPKEEVLSLTSPAGFAPRPV